MLSVNISFTNVWTDEYWGVNYNIFKCILILILHKLDNLKVSKIRPLIQGYNIPSKSGHQMILAKVLTNYIYPFSSAVYDYVFLIGLVLICSVNLKQRSHVN